MFKKLIKKLIEKFAPKVKAEINDFAAEAIQKLKIKASNYDYEVKVNALVEYVMSRIELPLVLQPFKKVVRNVIKDVAEDVAKDLIKDLKDRVEDKWNKQL